jgi:tight adherence protein B
MPMSAAVAAWPGHCPDEARTAVADAARRVALGATPDEALAAMSWLGQDGAATAAAIARLHAVSGCDAAGLLDACARSHERRAALSRTASVATSGTKLSGRIVAALPLTVLPLVPAAGGSLFDRRGSLMLLCGAFLLLAGAWWIGRLLPRPPRGDEVGELAAFLSSAIAGGVGMRDALTLCATAASPSVRNELAICTRRVRLGAGWTTALDMSSDDGLRAMAAVLRRAEELGVPVARSLETFAERRIEDAEATFDREARRAPVLMVLPLTICILPAYVVLAIGPILRGLSLG